MRELIDDYLDDSLAPAARAEFEKTVGADGRAAGLLAQMKAERAVRAAAMNSYMPTAKESGALAAAVLAACEAEALAPVGRIGGQRALTRWLAVAAGLAIVIGAFSAGRMSAPVVKDTT